MKKQPIHRMALAAALFLFSGSAVRAQFTSLYSFSGGADGRSPSYGAPVISGSTLYGTANLGANGGGVVFSMNTDGSGYTALHTFTSTAPDGYQPLGSLAFDGSTLYGTTYYGGGAGGASGNGAIFSVNADGTGYTTLYSFSTSAGYKPYSTLTLNGSTLYGTTYYSSGGLGSVFSFDTTNSGYTALYNFTGSPTSGSRPLGALMLNGSTLYGMTIHGGTSSGNNTDGVAFKINTDGSGYNNLYSFAGGTTNGANPYGALTLAGSTLYGMTRLGGSANSGVIFSINLDGTGYTDRYSFAGGTDGANPNGSLTLVGSTLYGTTKSGGSANKGTVFGINLDGTGYTELYSFTGGSDGANPVGDLTVIDNILYGWTSAGGSGAGGTIFSLQVPEPSNFWLLGGGLSILLFSRRRL